jgi:hypothetical protein
MASKTGTIFTLTRKIPTLTDASLTSSPFFPLHLRSKAAQEPGVSVLLGRFSYIRRALYRNAWPVQNMRVNHGGGDIRMPQEFLHRPDVIVCFKQMCSKGVPQPRRFCIGSKIYLSDLAEADPPWSITSNSDMIRKAYLYCNL